MQDNLSFSDKQVEGKPQQQIAVTQDGKSVIMNDTSSSTDADPRSLDGINEPHDQFKQNGIGTDSNNEERAVDADTKEERIGTCQEQSIRMIIHIWMMIHYENHLII
jgi:hypothetical protein